MKKTNALWTWIRQSILFNADEIQSPRRYKILRRNIIMVMLLVTFVPMISMAIINYHQYRASLMDEIVTPLRLLSNKTAHSFELFLEERTSTIRSVASLNSYEDLVSNDKLNRTYQVLKKEFGGFVDLGVIDSDGIQVGYAGPYDLVGKNYAEQAWFDEATVRGVYVSDVFLGYRDFPHIAIAVQQYDESGRGWFLRATIDTTKFDNIIASIGIDDTGDVFMVNRKGTLQTPSRYYGDVLEECRWELPLKSRGTQLIEDVDTNGNEVIIAYTAFQNHEFGLVVIKPKSVILKAWYTLKSEMFFITIGGSILIILVVFRVTNLMVSRIREADERRESAFREMENTQKLSSIGRLAAGVAHEINNPLAIINQKSGLMKDLLDMQTGFEQKDKFLELTQSILGSVDRCKTITHRLLGFARRMEVSTESLNLNEVIKEVLSFIEKEALYRKIELTLNLDASLPSISTDKGQIQQVFLNILTNSFAAVEDGGHVTINSRMMDSTTVAVSVKDDGCGMTEETMSHIFEPFFTTKHNYGTGLGLPITYGIIKKLGGDLKVTSNVGEGTVFTVYLDIKTKKRGNV